jgi:ligand-binding SRPBCC domain-containing protein
MPLLYLTTEIKAPMEVVFDLARSIDFHQEAAHKTKEKAIGGRTSGLIELGETVVWEAVHFGIRQKLSTKITAMNAPHSFKDEMVFGAFKSMKHDHAFFEENGLTTMIDFFHFESPFGLIGKLFNSFVLKSYLRKFLKERNKAIKEKAESL